MNRFHSTGVLITCVALSWALAACGSTTDTGVASAGGATRPATDNVKLMSDFAGCLNDAGLTASISPEGYLDFGADAVFTVAADSGSGNETVTVDGKDISDIWAGCKKKVPGVQPMPSDSDNDVAAMNTAGAEWAACVRENGFPDIEDPKDGVVTLPANLTPDTAGALVEACPLGEDASSLFGLAASDSWEPEFSDAVLSALYGMPGLSLSGAGAGE